MKFSTIVLGIGVVVAVLGFVGQVALLGLVPNLLLAAGAWNIAEVLEERL